MVSFPGLVHLIVCSSIAILSAYEDDYFEDQDPGYTSSYSTSSRRSRRLRRASTFDRSRSSTPFLDSFRRLMTLKFKPKGTHRSGVSLTEALDNIRISGDKTYSARSLNADSRGNLYMRIIVRTVYGVRWEQSLMFIFISGPVIRL